MSVSLSWRPRSDQGVSIGGSSALHEALKEAFGDFPMVLGETAVPILFGIRACGHEQVNDLIVAIHAHDEIEVLANW